MNDQLFNEERPMMFAFVDGYCDSAMGYWRLLLLLLLLASLAKEAV